MGQAGDRALDLDLPDPVAISIENGPGDRDPVWMLHSDGTVTCVNLSYISAPDSPGARCYSRCF